MAEYLSQKVTFDRGRFWYDANGVSREATDNEIAIEFVQLQSRLRASEAQKERCAGMTASEWRHLFIKTQEQWETAKAERDTCLRRLSEKRDG